MSFELAGRVIGDPELSDIAEFTVLLALADATNKETHTCYPSVGRIAAVARISRVKAFRVLKAIEAKGWIQIVRRRGKKATFQSSVYRIIKYGVHQTLPPVSNRHYPSIPQTLPPSVQQTPKPVKKEPRKKPEHLDSSCLPNPEEQQKVAKLFDSLKNRFKSQ